MNSDYFLPAAIGFGAFIGFVIGIFFPATRRGAVKSFFVCCGLLLIFSFIFDNDSHSEARHFGVTYVSLVQFLGAAFLSFLAPPGYLIGRFLVTR